LNLCHTAAATVSSTDQLNSTRKNKEAFKNVAVAVVVVVVFVVFVAVIAVLA